MKSAPVGSVRTCLKRAAVVVAMSLVGGSPAAWGAPDVPAKFVEYVESSGSEYLELGDVLTSNTVATVDFVPMCDLSYVSVFGNRTMFAYITHDWIYVRGKRIVTEAYQKDSTKHSVVTIDVPQQKIFANGGELKLGDYAGNENGASSAPAYLFWADAEGKSKLRVYSCVITNDNALAMDLRPCVDENGVVGMYDLVSRKILRNAGTEAFVASATEVPVPKELTRDSLTIEANTLHYAADALTPTYGMYPYLEAGSNIVCTAPSSWTSPSKGVSLKCTGYRLSLYDEAKSAWQLTASGNASSYTYVHADGQRAKLEWQFTVEQAVVQLKPGDDIVTAVGLAGVGDVFELAEGTYELTRPLVISAACTVKGAGKDATILRQTAENTNVVQMCHAGAWLQDCRITGAKWTKETWRGGALLFPADGGGTVTNCHVCGNRNNSNQNKGVGIDCQTANALVTHCIVNDNKVTGGTNSSQGGMRLTAGRVDHCLVYDNAGHQAGGIGVEGPAYVTYCTIVNNSIYSSATMSTGGGVATFTSYKNSSATGGGVFENCVIYGNRCPEAYVADGYPEVSAVWDVTFRNCAFPKGLKLPAKAVAAGSMFVDVVFTDFANGDYTQKPSSPARNLGYYTPYVEPKVLNCECSADKTSLLTGGNVALTSFVSGTNAADSVAYAWTVTRAGGASETLTSACPVYTPTSAGDYSVTLTVTRNGTDSKTADQTLRFTAFDETTRVSTSEQLVRAVSNLCDGVTLELEEKTYELTSALVLSVAGKIVGKGIDRTVLRQTAQDRRLVELRHPKAVVRGCTITGVRVPNEIGVAAAVYIPDVGGGGTITYCRVTDNTSSRNQNKCCGIYCTSSAGVISHCIVDNNKVTSNSNETQGGIRLTAGTVDHCLVYGNVGHQTGGISLDGPATVRYCTVVANGVYEYSFSSSCGGGIAVRKSGATVENSIVYGNTCPDKYNGTGKPEIWFGDASYTATFANCAFPTTVTLPSGVKGTPFQCEVQFTDFANGDYTQRISSPAKDIGYYTPYDSGNVFYCECTATATALCLGSSVTFNGFAAGVKDGDAVTYEWTVTRPDETTETLSGASVVYRPASAGGYSVSLSATKNGTETKSAAMTPTFTAYANPTPVATVAELEAAAANPCEGLVLRLTAGAFALTKRLDMTIAYTIRGAGRDATVIRPAYTDRQVVKIDNAGAVLEDVTVTGGDIDRTENFHGAGVQIGSSGGTVRNCRITGNRIRKNVTNGAGVAMFGSAALLDRCIVDDNTMPAGLNHDGAGVYITGGTLDNCLICRNALKDGGKDYNFRGGGVYAAGNCTIRNCTIAGNAAVNGGGGIFLAGEKKTCTLVNTIVAGNSTLAGRDTSVGAPEWLVSGSGAKFSAKGCLFGAGTVTNAVTGAGWIVADPKFKNAAAGNFRVRSDSPAVDAGVSCPELSATDVNGRPRVRKYGVDIGCCENQSEGLLLLVR